MRTVDAVSYVVLSVLALAGWIGLGVGMRKAWDRARHDRGKS